MSIVLVFWFGRLTNLVWYLSVLSEVEVSLPKGWFGLELVISIFYCKYNSFGFYLWWWVIF